jgi:hypothetical protein
MLTHAPRILFWLALAGIVLLTVHHGADLRAQARDGGATGPSLPCNASVCKLGGRTNG